MVADIDTLINSHERGYMDFEIPWALRDIELPTSRKEHLIIEHTVSFVLRNGDQSEVRLRLDASASRRVPFIDVNHHLHPYYQWLKSTKACLEDRAPHLLPEGWSFWRRLDGKKKEQEKWTGNRSINSPGERKSTESLGGLLGHYVEDDLSPLSLTKKVEKDRQEKTKEIPHRAKKHGFGGPTASSSSSSLPKKSRSENELSGLLGAYGAPADDEGKKNEKSGFLPGLGELLGNYGDDGNDSKSEKEPRGCLPGTLVPSTDASNSSAKITASVSVQADIASSPPPSCVPRLPDGSEDLDAIAASTYAQMQEAQQKYAHAYHALQEKKKGSHNTAVQVQGGHVPHALRGKTGSGGAAAPGSGKAAPAAASPYVTLQQHRAAIRAACSPILPGTPVTSSASASAAAAAAAGASAVAAAAVARQSASTKGMTNSVPAARDVVPGVTAHTVVPPVKVIPIGDDPNQAQQVSGKSPLRVLQTEDVEKPKMTKREPRKEAAVKAESDALFTSLLEYAETSDGDDEKGDDKPKKDKDEKHQKKNAAAPSNALSALLAHDDESSEEETEPFWPEAEKKLDQGNVSLIQDIGAALLKQDLNAVRFAKKVAWPEFSFLKSNEGAYFRQVVDACIKKIETGQHKSAPTNANPNKKVVGFMCKLLMEQQSKCANATIKRAGKITTKEQEKQDKQNKMEERRQRALKLLGDKKGGT